MPEYLTIQQIAKVMHTTDSAVRGWIVVGIKSQGYLAATKEYKEYRITPKALRKFLGKDTYARHFGKGKTNG